MCIGIYIYYIQTVRFGTSRDSPLTLSVPGNAAPGVGSIRPSLEDCGLRSFSHLSSKRSFFWNRKPPIDYIIYIYNYNIYIYMNMCILYINYIIILDFVENRLTRSDLEVNQLHFLSIYRFFNLQFAVFRRKSLPCFSLGIEAEALRSFHIQVSFFFKSWALWDLCT